MSLLRRALALAVASALLSGCANQNDPATPVPVVGTTYRIGPPKLTEGSQVTVDIMRDRKRCQQVFSNPDRRDPRFETHEDRLQSCVPKVDRAAGQVELSFRLAQPDNQNRALFMAVERPHVQVLHMERNVPIFEFEQYDPTTVGQLFIVLVDWTHTMNIEDNEGITRIQRVIDAIWASRKVFVGEGSAVAIFKYNTRLMGAAGQPPAEVVPVRTERQLQDELAQIGRPNGWTHLFPAVRTAIGPLLDGETAVASFLNQNDVQPTVILLTDGFNSTRRDEICADNAPKLAETLQALRNARRKPPTKRPDLYTVGFGAPPFRPGWKAPKDDIAVTGPKLCGQFVNNLIDGDLDVKRIDNVSLEWLAEAGGGRAFLKAQAKQIAEALQSTAPRRYSWYKVKYKVDPYYHRTSFATRIKLVQLVAADAAVTFHPSAWFDVPTGLLPSGEDRFVEVGDIRRATGLAVPLLGFFIILGFFGPAMFNARRALFRRAKKSGKKKK